MRDVSFGRVPPSGVLDKTPASRHQDEMPDRKVNKLLARANGQCRLVALLPNIGSRLAA